ncbi:hypothetical protein HYFRA_00006447 [Hymenoscyphus fraxineus]|uniref:Uncharacterized protein n=1 Tax=Hymenoscyphus fraxineus TaxID=746836 RepID=A0A9N9PFZ2_9HELO|nr:hypothetical protein HYFRA_00006447 [Hymenoscyphus fraxineus]
MASQPGEGQRDGKDPTSALNQRRSIRSYGLLIFEFSQKESLPMDTPRHVRLLREWILFTKYQVMVVMYSVLCEANPQM